MANKKHGNKQDKYDPAYVVKKLNEHTKNAEIPILAACCYENGWSRRHMYKLRDKHPEIGHAMEELQLRKEAVLEHGGLTGKFQPTMCALSLKQIGWREKQEIDNNVRVDDGWKEALEKSVKAIDEGCEDFVEE